MREGAGPPWVVVHGRGEAAGATAFHAIQQARVRLLLLAGRGGDWLLACREDGW